MPLCHSSITTHFLHPITDSNKGAPSVLLVTPSKLLQAQEIRTVLSSIRQFGENLTLLVLVTPSKLLQAQETLATAGRRGRVCLKLMQYANLMIICDFHDDVGQTPPISKASIICNSLHNLQRTLALRMLLLLLSIVIVISA